MWKFLYTHDVLVEDVFVPDAFVWQLRPQMPRGPHFSDALYRFPFLGLFSWPMAAVALGIAQRALDEITAMALAKTPRLGTGTLCEQPLFQLQLAQAVAHVRSARAWLHEVMTTVWEQTLGGAAVAMEDRAALQLAATNATHSAGRRGGLGVHGWRRQCQLSAQPLAAPAAGHPRRDATCGDGPPAVRRQ